LKPSYSSIPFILLTTKNFFQVQSKTLHFKTDRKFWLLRHTGHFVHVIPLLHLNRLQLVRFLLGDVSHVVRLRLLHHEEEEEGRFSTKGIQDVEKFLVKKFFLVKNSLFVLTIVGWFLSLYIFFKSSSKGVLKFLLKKYLFVLIIVWRFFNSSSIFK